jgi:hypothetical protein
MKTFDLNTNNQTSRNKTRVFVFIVLLILSSIGVFGQNNNIEAKGDINFTLENLEVTKTSIEVVSIESQIDFMGWFMGSKYNQNSADINSSASKKSTLSTKKQIISSGIEPNKVLYRTFVKRVLNKDNAIA